MDTFVSLAELNLKAIQETGARKLITTCPECAYTLKYTYPDQVGYTGLEIIHLTEFLAANDTFSTLLRENGKPQLPVTYHDPCRMGRYQGIYDQPRSLILAMGYQITEMEHHRRSSLCCGTSCWSSCGQMNKRTQIERLNEAKATGSGQMITSCVKCQIHFKCAQNDPLLGNDLEIEIQDLTTIIANGLTENNQGKNRKEVAIDR